MSPRSRIYSGGMSSGYTRSGYLAIDPPSRPLNSWQKYWSRNSYAPPNLGRFGKRVRAIRSDLVSGDRAILMFILFGSYFGLLLIGVFSRTVLEFVFWSIGVTSVYLLVIFGMIFRYGKRLIYARTNDGRSALRKLLDSPMSTQLSTETLNKYIKTLVELDGELAEVDSARIDLVTALDFLPEIRKWNALDQLSLEVEAAEHDIDAGGVSALRQEINSEINRLDVARENILVRMEQALAKSLEGYDPVVLAERKKIAEKAIEVSRKIPS